MAVSAYREVFKRTEIKYLINEEQYRALMPCLERMAKVDEYGLSRINNIYYDTRDYRLVRTSMEKPLYKEKLRLRTYGATADGTNAFVEIKKKYDGTVYKRRISGKYREMYEQLSEQEADLGPGQIAREIEAFIRRYEKLVPAMTICYDRVAMAGTIDPDFRVTFDTNIEWNSACRDLRHLLPGRGLLKPGQYLMEIKISNAFPMELAQTLSELRIFPTSFSKYGAGYADMLIGIRESVPGKVPAVRERKQERRRPRRQLEGGMVYV